MSRLTIPLVAVASAALAFIIAAPPQAVAQAERAPQERAPAITTSKINITAEQRHTIKENLLPKQSSGSASGGSQLEVGATVPANVELQRVPDLVAGKVPQIRSYSYFIDGSRIMLVDTTERKIVEIVD